MRYIKCMIDALAGKTQRRKILLSVCAVLVCCVIAITVLVVTHSSAPIPKSIQKNTAYTLYYPNSLPKGYRYKHSSIRQEAGIVFYNVANDKRSVSVSQQALPSNPPVLSALGGFTKLEVPAGKAAVGANGSSPTAIILTDSTIITINGSSGTPQDVVVTIAKGMTSLPE